MAIEGGLQFLAQRLDDWRTNREVGNEVAVHDVEVKDGAAAFNGFASVGGEFRKVGGENGGRKFDVHGRACLLVV